MYKKIVSQAPMTGLVTLEEVKRQCRVFTTFEDDYLLSLIPVYFDLCQSYTGRMLTTGDAVAVVDDGCSSVILPFGEVTSVTKLVLDGSESTDFTFDDVSQRIHIGTPYSSARIEFAAGYTTLPTSVKQAILVMCSTAYNNRDDYVLGQSANQMPSTSRDLLDRVRLPWQ